LQKQERPGLAARGVAGWRSSNRAPPNHHPRPGQHAGNHFQVLVRATAAPARPSVIRAANLPPGQLTLRLQKGSHKQYLVVGQQSFIYNAFIRYGTTKT
jgi:hypothetical protein